MKSHSRPQIHSFSPSISHPFPLRPLYQPPHCSQASSPGLLQRTQALDTVLPRPTSPNSPVFYPVDREMRRVLEDARDAVAACEVSCFYVSAKREGKGGIGDLRLREIPKLRLLDVGRRQKKGRKGGFREEIEKKRRISGKFVRSAKVLPPIAQGYRLFHKRRLHHSLLF